MSIPLVEWLKKVKDRPTLALPEEPEALATLLCRIDTPGHAAVRLRTSGGDAVFSGDLMHRVVQVAEPQWNSRFCHDGPRARASRQAFVEHHTDSGVLVCAAHFPRPGYIVTEDGTRRFVPAS